MARRLGFLATLLSGFASYACAVCGANGQQGQGAYVTMTWVMSFTPLIAMGSIVFYIFWRVRKHNAAEPPPAVPPTQQP
jgi:hypothetical protein